MNTVTVTWPSTTFSNGAAVTSYTVRRYDAITGIAGTILTVCTGTVQATSCTETLVPPGQWQYTITAVAGNWHAAESAKKHRHHNALTRPTSRVLAYRLDR